MTSPYICASCRRLVSKAWRIRKVQWDSRASFISFSQPQPANEGAATTKKGDEHTHSRRTPGRSKGTEESNPRQHQWPLARNSRDDILESLFLSPRDKTENGVRNGRYSAPKARNSDTGEDGTLTSSTSSLDPEGNNSSPTEVTPSFRRLSIPRKPPVTTLKRLRTQRRELGANTDRDIRDTEDAEIKLHANGSNESQNIAVNTIIKRLGQATERTDFKRAEALWKVAQELYPEAQVTLPAAEGTKAESSTVIPDETGQTSEVELQSRLIPMKLYNMFLFAFMTLRRSDRAIAIWNHMVLSGRQPEQATWGAMLQGCQRARDPRSVEIIWGKMRAAGIDPDVRSWTTRIGALIHSGKADLGLRALAEMGRIWLEATQAANSRGTSINTNATTGDSAEPAKPTVITVNVVIAGLIKVRKRELTPRILAWAKKLGIEPNIVTFNTLLGSAVRDGRTDEAGRLLQQMESLKIQPDIVTFTIILDGLFQNDAMGPSDQPAADKGEAVAAVLAQMEESGVEANTLTYGTIIDNLLKSSTPNLPAARAVLDHMANRNIRPSPHIYTILLTYYFSQNPPDLAALDVLWNRIRLERGVVDNIFYDRMLEGYGKLGESGKMMTFLRRMAKEGKAPGWEALIVVLKALVHAEEWDMVGDLVSDVEREHGLFYAVMRPRRGEMEFQQLVQELRDEGLVASPSAANGSQEESEDPLTVY